MKGKLTFVKFWISRRLLGKSNLIYLPLNFAQELEMLVLLWCTRLKLIFVWLQFKLHFRQFLGPGQLCKLLQYYQNIMLMVFIIIFNLWLQFKLYLRQCLGPGQLCKTEGFHRQECEKGLKIVKWANFLCLSINNTKSTITIVE